MKNVYFLFIFISILASCSTSQKKKTSGLKSQTKVTQDNKVQKATKTFLSKTGNSNSEHTTSNVNLENKKPICNKAPVVLTGPKLSQSIVKANEKSEILITNFLDSECQNGGLVVEQVVFDSSDSNEQKVVQVLGFLHDDGKNGDKIAGDHVFSGKIIIGPLKENEEIIIRTSAAFKDLNFNLPSTTWEEITARSFKVSGYKLEISDDKIWVRNSKERIEKSFSIPKNSTIIKSGNAEYMGIFKSEAGVCSPFTEYGDSDCAADTEFEYYNSNGKIWNIKSQSFYLPQFPESGNSKVISDLGERILLITPSSTNKDTLDGININVYDNKGLAVLKTSSKMYTLLKAGLSSKGKCVLISGYSPESKLGGEVYEVFEVSSGKRWLTEWTPPKGGALALYGVENSKGCFDLYSDKTLILSTQNKHL